MNAPSPRRIQVTYFSTWADGLQSAGPYLDALRTRDLSSRVSDPRDPGLMRMARLDCDWDGEVLRSLATMAHPSLVLDSAFVTGPRGLLDLIMSKPAPGTASWLVFTDQRPAVVATIVGTILRHFTEQGGKVLYWSYDEASRRMGCFATSVAPYLSILLHDESPLSEDVRLALPRTCRTLQTSWLANIVPFAFPFHETVEDRIVFLGSRLGITPHRQMQIDALRTRFKDRFTAITDHSLPVSERGGLGRMKVHVCPEGRFYASPAMSRTHTDRPFLAGCLGQVPVSEESAHGGRLHDLARSGFVVPYAHGDGPALLDACERALEMHDAHRRAIYQYFNENGTIGTLVAREIALSET